MKTTVDKYSFARAFEDYSRGKQFSYGGLEALFEYLEAFEEDTGTELELDVIAICCDFTEYDSAIEAAESYDFEKDEEADDDEAEEAALEWLQDHTTVIEVDGGGVVVQNF